MASKSTIFFVVLISTLGLGYALECYKCNYDCVDPPPEDTASACTDLLSKSCSKGVRDSDGVTVGRTCSLAEPGAADTDDDGITWNWCGGDRCNTAGSLAGNIAMGLVPLIVSLKFYF